MLLDSDPPSLESDVPRKYEPLKVLTKFVGILEKAMQRSRGSKTRPDEWLYAEGQPERLLAAMKRAGLLPKSTTTLVLTNLIRVFAANLNTVYTPRKRLSGDVYLIHAREVNRDDEDFIAPEDAAARWRAFIPRLRVLPASGNHMTMLQRPHIDGIADVARKIWDQGLVIETPIRD
jgi:thioesterase domain-containing protein